MASPIYYAHSLKNKPEAQWEFLTDHLGLVAQLAEDFAGAFGLSEWGRSLGLLHDLGKATPEFLMRLRGEGRVDHAVAGARQAIQSFNGLGRFLAYAVLGHHGGLPDAGEVDRRLAGTAPDADHSFVIALPETLPRPNLKMVGQSQQTQAFTPSFLVRMLYSCLVDADFLATAAFYARQPPHQGIVANIEELASRLDLQLDQKPRNGDIGSLRRQVLERCREVAFGPPGFYSLTVPTGGGKTLSGLSFALNHAVHNRKRRVVTVIPYTSIIEQTAQVYRDHLGDEVVLEHHSNYTPPAFSEDPLEDEDRRKLRLAEENWDAPLVVTTAVQFYESLFAHNPARCRKLHNIVGAVIILDEAQLMPSELLYPCLEALRQLVDNYGATIVFCTATQPALNLSPWLPKGLPPAVEIVEDPQALHSALKRTRLEPVGEIAEDDLAARLAEQKQVLAVVNKRDHARDLANAVKGLVDDVFHLSARMCPAHRSRDIGMIRERLSQQLPCRVISTQLIEAGVDLDFPQVWRAESGLDSLIQAAGRCNREGLSEQPGRVLIFRHPKDRFRGSAQRRVAITRPLLENSKDPMAPQAVMSFFNSSMMCLNKV